MSRLRCFSFKKLTTFFKKNVSKIKKENDIASSHPAGSDNYDAIEHFLDRVWIMMDRFGLGTFLRIQT